jgi:hypothetical protein
MKIKTYLLISTISIITLVMIREIKNEPKVLSEKSNDSTKIIDSLKSEILERDVEIDILKDEIQEREAEISYWGRKYENSKK